jgi:hypothetical protein
MHNIAANASEQKKGKRIFIQIEDPENIFYRLAMIER